MSEEIQQYRSSDPKRKPKEEIRRFLKPPNFFGKNNAFIWLLIKICVISALLEANYGLLPKWITVPILLILIIFFIRYEFIKNREQISKPQYRIGMPGLMLLAISVSYFLFFHEPSPKDHPCVVLADHPNFQTFSVDSLLVIVVDFENQGLPANNVRAYMQIEFPNEDVPNTEFFKNKKPTLSVGFLGKQKLFHQVIHSGYPISKDEMRLIKDNKMWLYVLGFVDYDDIDGTHHYRTEYCLRYDSLGFSKLFTFRCDICGDHFS